MYCVNTLLYMLIVLVWMLNKALQVKTLLKWSFSELLTYNYNGLQQKHYSTNVFGRIEISDVFMFCAV